MATLVLTAAASAAGPAIVNAGLGLGLSVGAGIGLSTGVTAAAGIIGSYVDRALLGPGGRQVQEGPRLSDLQVTTSTEGAPIPRVHGYARIGGQIIWATRFKEVQDTETHSAGGKGGGGGQKVTTREYRYYASFAIGLCEGPVSRIGRIWADGKLMQLADVTHRVYLGTEDQPVDPLIESIQGEAPAFRGLAYVVFEDLFLEPYGNRVPQITVEVIRSVPRFVQVGGGDEPERLYERMQLSNTLDFGPLIVDTYHPPANIGQRMFVAASETDSLDIVICEINLDTGQLVRRSIIFSGSPTSNARIQNTLILSPDGSRLYAQIYTPADGNTLYAFNTSDLSVVGSFHLSNTNNLVIPTENKLCLIDRNYMYWLSPNLSLESQTDHWDYMNNEQINTMWSFFPDDDVFPHHVLDDDGNIWLVLEYTNYEHPEFFGYAVSGLRVIQIQESVAAMYDRTPPSLALWRWDNPPEYYNPTIIRKIGDEFVILCPNHIFWQTPADSPAALPDGTPADRWKIARIAPPSLPGWDSPPPATVVWEADIAAYSDAFWDDPQDAITAVPADLPGDGTLWYFLCPRRFDGGDSLYLDARAVQVDLEDGSVIQVLSINDFTPAAGTTLPNSFGQWPLIYHAGNVYAGMLDDRLLPSYWPTSPLDELHVWHLSGGTPGPNMVSVNAESLIRAVDMIPASGEFMYATETVWRDEGGGESRAETLNSSMGAADMVVSLDQMQETLPNADSVALVVAWFGTDLRAEHCTIMPGVESRTRETYPLEWSVSSYSHGTWDRDEAHLVSQDANGNPLFGGTPSDEAVRQGIREMKARGLRIVFYPFILMDVPPGNGLPDPYGGSEQAAFPWRGRITCHPAPGQPGTADKTAAAKTQIDAFFAPGGEGEYRYRQMVLHYAQLCAEEGGVDAFIIGSELVGLTHVRDDTGAYPAVDHLRQLAADVKAILSTAKVSYAADWTEWNNHRPSDGSGDVIFHLDPLWSDPNIDFIAIDNYLPMSDWRDGSEHLDAQAGWESIYDLDYLRSNIRGGELYDWFYASQADRDAQVRTPITDGDHGEPWVHRYKDLWSWWSNPHHDRPGGVRSAMPTAWVPQSKPIWFTEAGCPAVDKGTNQPNVFYDPKSAESAFPYYSRGSCDDLIQRRYIEALLGFWGDAANVPTSSVYGGPMVDARDIFLWTWDARPWPEFPGLESVWSDAPNWRYGHWLTGRMGMAGLAETVAALCERGGLAPEDYDVSQLYGVVTGLVEDRVMSARQAIEALMLSHQFDAVESDGRIRFVHRDRRSAVTLTADDLVAPDERGTSPWRLTRGQETDLPLSAKISYLGIAGGYRQASVEARRGTVSSQRVATADLPIVMDQCRAQAVAETWLHETWIARERASFALPPSLLALDPGDVVTLDLGGRRYDLRLSEITDAYARTAQSLRVESSLYLPTPSPDRVIAAPPPAVAGRPVLALMDLPLLTEDQVEHAPWTAAHARPWPGAVALYKSADGASWSQASSLTLAASMGETTTALPAGQPWRWSAARLTVKLYRGGLSSASDLDVLGGANALALESAPGIWEVVQFRSATLLAPGTYELTGLLRGQLGSEPEIMAAVPAGARVVVLDAALRQPVFALTERGLPRSWRFGPAGDDIGAPTYQSFDQTVQGIGLRPLSPVHVRGVRQGDDLVISWIRRTRIGGDSWDAAEVPLGEESESYQLDVLDQPSGTVVRTLSTSSPSVTYTAAQQTTDFGAIPAQVTVRVHQMSATFGRGAGKEATLG